MTYIAIQSRGAEKILFDGYYEDVRACLEDAVSQSVPLPGADLTGAVLMNAELDGAVMPGACFAESNLTGANLSEAELTGTNFSNAGLLNTCFSYSFLKECNFTGSFFGATDITGAVLQDVAFSTESAFTLNFAAAGAVLGCVFQDDDDSAYPFSRPPIVLHGLEKPVVFMDRHIQIGATVKTYEEWLFSVRENVSVTEAEKALFCVFLHQYTPFFGIVSGENQMCCYKKNQML